MALIYALNELLGRLPASQITMTDENTNYPKAGLSDGVPSKEARFNTAGADREAKVNGDFLQGQGAMEGAGTLPPGWTNRSTGAGSAVRSTANPHGGTAHIRLAGGVGGVGAASIDVTYRPGDQFCIFSCWIDSISSQFVEVRVQNLHTGKYLSSTGTWQAGATWAVRGNNDTYTDIGAGFNKTLESLLACQRETVTLRITLYNANNVTIDVDDVAVGLAPDVMGIHGHNIPMEMTPEWRESSDGVLGTSTLVASATPYQPSFAHLPILTGARATKQWLHFKIPGTPSDGSIPLLGELSVWCGVTAARSVNFDPRLEFAFRQKRNEVGGHVRVHRQGAWAPRVYRFNKRVVSASEYQTVRDALLQAQGGGLPMLWIPDSAAPAPLPVLYAVVPPMSAWTQPLPTSIGVWDLEDIELHEQPFPNVAL